MCQFASSGGGPPPAVLVTKALIDGAYIGFARALGCLAQGTTTSSQEIGVVEGLLVYQQ